MAFSILYFVDIYWSWLEIVIELRRTIFIFFSRKFFYVRTSLWSWSRDYARVVNIKITQNEMRLIVSRWNVVRVRLTRAQNDGKPVSEGYAVRRAEQTKRVMTSEAPNLTAEISRTENVRSNVADFAFSINRFPIETFDRKCSTHVFFFDPWRRRVVDTRITPHCIQHACTHRVIRNLCYDCFIRRRRVHDNCLVLEIL